MIGQPISDTKTIRVFVRGNHFRYGSCSALAYKKSKTQNCKVKVTFTNYRMNDGKNPSKIASSEAMVHVDQVSAMY